jgi:hypothetical protein
MKITYKREKTTPPPVVSVVELTEDERTAFVAELQALNSWYQSKQPVLHKVWTALKHKETV